MSDKAEPALKILADVVRHPAFKQEEIDRLKNQRLDGLRVAMQQPGSLARFVTARVVFGAAPTATRPAARWKRCRRSGATISCSSTRSIISREDAAFVLAGDLTLEQGKAFAEKYFGDWKSRELA